MNAKRLLRALYGQLTNARSTAKYLILTLFLFWVSQSALAQPTFKWAQGGQSGTLDEYVQTVATDASGNVYVAGSFEGTVDFDNTAAVFNLTAAGSFDAFIAKYTSAGALTWAKKLSGSAGIEEIYAIAVDASGNVYVAGYFEGTVDFDPDGGVVNITSNGGYDAFFGRYTSLGAYSWVNKIGSTTNDFATIITLDATPNVYVGGIFTGTIDVDPSASTVNRTSVGGEDGFFGKYTSGGVYTWAYGMGSTNDDGCRGLSIVSNTHVWYSGYYGGTMNVDPAGTLQNALNNGGLDGFFGQYNQSDGKVGGWGTIRSSGDDVITSIVVSGTAVYTSGYFSTTATMFGANSTSASKVSAGGTDIFVARHDAGSMNLIWLDATGGTGNDGVNLMAVDGSSNPYITGYFEGSFDFDPTASTTIVTSLGGQDCFGARIVGTTGALFGVGTSGSALGDEQGTSIALDGSSNIYLAEIYENTINLDFRGGVYNTTSAGGVDWAVMRYDQITYGADPTAQPTAFSTSAVSTTSATVSWTAAAGAPAGYIVTRAVASPPVNTPLDGNTYIAGQTSKDFIVAYVGSATSFGETGLTASTTYQYRIYSYTGAGSTINYLTTSPLTGSLSTSSSGPPTITSISPLFGAIGSSVTITGTNFNTTPASNVVYFGSVKATVTSATATQLTVTVPNGSTLMPISVTSPSGLTAYAPRPFIVTISGAAALSATSFAAKQDIAAGNFPDGIVTGDFDLDSKPDVAQANGNSNTIGVFRNTSTIGSISLPAAASLISGTSPMGPVIVDYDGDGKLDVVAPNPTSTSVSIYRNTTGGAISFASKVDITGLPSPRVIAVGDMDGDGKPDLAITNINNASVTIYRNTSTIGTISSSFVTSLTTGTTPYGVAFADINGDALVDMLVANSASNSVSVFRNTSTVGLISFAPKLDFPTASNPQMLAIADYDFDGKLDIATTCSVSNVVSVLRNTTTGPTSISFAVKVDLIANTNVVGMAADDLDGDGKIDIVAANVATNNVSVFKNNSTSGVISFGTKLDFAVGVNPHYVMSITDMDGDGKKDILVTNSGEITFSVLRNNISVSISEPTAQPTSFLASNQTSTSADVAFTAAAGSPSGYIAIRATGAAPTTDPVDNTAYTVGTTIGGGSDRVVALGASTSFSETGLTASTTYHYKIYSYNGSGSNINYRITSPLQGTVTTTSPLATEPTAQPTGFVAGNPTNGSIDISFTAASGSPGGYLVVRGPAGGAAPTFIPTDGTSHLTGASVGTNNTIAFSGGATFFTDIGLAASTAYTYRVYSFNGSGSTINYLLTNPLPGTGSTNNVPPTVPPAFGTITTSNTLDLYAVRFINSSTALAGGDNGIVMKTTNGGTSWSTITVPTSDAIWNFGFVSTTNGLAVGSAGLIMNTVNGGDTWTLVSNPATDALYAIYMIPGTTVGFVAGDNGVVMKTTNNGATWTELTGAASLTSSYYNTIYFKNEFEGLIAGPDGVIRTTDGGANWTDFSSDAILWYAFPNANVGYGVGSGGIIKKTTDAGATWTTQTSGVTTTLWSAYFVDASIGFAVGAEGVILKTTNGGTTWTKATEAATGVVYSIHFSPSINGLVAGEGGYIAKAEAEPSALTYTQQQKSSINYGGSETVTLTISPASDVSRITSVKFKTIGVIDDAKGMAPTSTTLSASSGVYTGTVTSSTTNGDKVGFKYYFVIEYDTRFARKDSTAAGHLYAKYTDANELKFTGLKVGTSESDYQLISFPIQPDAASAQAIFGPSNKKDWRLFSSTPSASGTTYTEVTTGNVALGKGYWFITSTNSTVELGPGSAYNAKATDPFKLILALGYNLIGNPYNFNVGWTPGASVKELRTYFNGAWTGASQLEPYRGYFVDADTPGTYPVPLTGNFNGGRTRDLRIEQNESSWELDLVIEQNGLRNEMGKIGMHPDASIEYDMLDERVFPIPDFFNLASLNINRPEAGMPLEQDYITTAVNAVWEFTLKGKGESSPVTLSWNTESIASIGRDLYLFDEESISLIDMRTAGTHYTYTNKPLKIITGDPLFIKSHVKFGESRIGTLFPNPASQGFFVPVAMPSAGEVQVRILDMKGIEIATQVHFVAEGMQNINITGLPEGLNGLYLVTTETEGAGRKVQKLIFK